MCVCVCGGGVQTETDRQTETGRQRNAETANARDNLVYIFEVVERHCCLTNIPQLLLLLLQHPTAGTIIIIIITIVAAVVVIVAVQFSSRQHVCARKSPHSTPSLRSFPNAAFETVPMFVFLTMALSRPVVAITVYYYHYERDT